MERLLKEIANLSAQGLTRAAVAISFCRRLTQPIQEGVHRAFEYWGHRDPSRGQDRKVPREEIANRVARIMAGQIRDKGCPKAHCLKRPTDAVSFLESSELFCAFRVVSSVFALFFRAHPLGCNTTQIFCRPRSWSTGPPLLCLRGTLGRMPPPSPSCTNRRRRRHNSLPTPTWGVSRRWRSPEPQGRHCQPP